MSKKFVLKSKKTQGFNCIMAVVTRFAPSPTGFLHIGNARTGLFNWLYARNQGGKFLLRIEDTDRVRSTQEAIEVILSGMKWLGAEWDDEPTYQFARAARHQEVAHQLLKEGKAYYCYCSPEELQKMRDEARAAGKPPRYDGRWRDRDPNEAPKDVKPVVRFKAPQTGSSTIQDLVQGDVTVAHDQLDDLVLLRADGTPTYMLSVVVDDHDMDVTHIIRGDDHLTNAFRQKQIYDAMGWELPQFSHIPLIHGPDGAKLSKRHGALSVKDYEEMGFLPEAMMNYLLRLGWSHGDDEIISSKQAIEWFDLKSVNKSAARFDIVKLSSLNGHYIREADNQRLFDLIEPMIQKNLDRPLAQVEQTRILSGMGELKQRAKTTLELADNALIYCDVPNRPFDEKALKVLNEDAKKIIEDALLEIENINLWNSEEIEKHLRKWSEDQGLKFGKIAQPLRASLTGRAVSPGIFEIMIILGKNETIVRLKDVIKR